MPGNGYGTNGENEGPAGVEADDVKAGDGGSAVAARAASARDGLLSGKPRSGCPQASSAAQWLRQHDWENGWDTVGSFVTWAAMVPQGLFGGLLIDYYLKQKTDNPFVRLIVFAAMTYTASEGKRRLVRFYNTLVFKGLGHAQYWQDLVSPKKWTRYDVLNALFTLIGSGVFGGLARIAFEGLGGNPGIIAFLEGYHWGGTDALAWLASQSWFQAVFISSAIFSNLLSIPNINRFGWQRVVKGWNYVVTENPAYRHYRDEYSRRFETVQRMWKAYIEAKNYDAAIQLLDRIINLHNRPDLEYAAAKDVLFGGELDQKHHNITEILEKLINPSYWQQIKSSCSSYENVPDLGALSGLSEQLMDGVVVLVGYPSLYSAVSAYQRNPNGLSELRKPLIKALERIVKNIKAQRDQQIGIIQAKINAVCGLRSLADTWAIVVDLNAKPDDRKKAAEKVVNSLRNLPEGYKQGVDVDVVARSISAILQQTGINFEVNNANAAGSALLSSEQLGEVIQNLSPRADECLLAIADEHIGQKPTPVSWLEFNLRNIIGLTCVGVGIAGLLNFRDMTTATFDIFKDTTSGTAFAWLGKGLTSSPFPLEVFRTMDYITMSLLANDSIYGMAQKLFARAFNHDVDLHVISPWTHRWVKALTLGVCLVGGTPNAYQSLITGEGTGLEVCAALASVFIELYGFYLQYHQVKTQEVTQRDSHKLLGTTVFNALHQTKEADGWGNRSLTREQLVRYEASLAGAQSGIPVEKAPLWRRLPCLPFWREQADAATHTGSRAGSPSSSRSASPFLHIEEPSAQGRRKWCGWC